MKNIQCPHCKESFELENSGYIEILNQVKDEAFNDELERRLAKEAELSKSHLGLERAKIEAQFNEVKSNLQAEVNQLRAELESANDKKELAISKLKSEFSIENNRLENELKIQVLNAEQEKVNTQKAYELMETTKQEQIDYLKDLKQKLSVKQLGESLEQHCENEFNKVRHVAFPNAYFEKDNDASNGSKGDYIFKGMSNDGIELLSIMFEMKTEQDVTATKQKNDHFLKKLDTDRTQKKCEYAILVSTLEADSDLYNQGIVDKSHKYPKMYVIRPQFFIPMISMLHNMALNALEYKRDLAKLRNEELDVANFEEQVNEFKRIWGNHASLAKRHHEDAIKEINKTIENLEKVRNLLESSNNSFDRGSNKIEKELNIKRLTRNNPTMKARFDALSNNK